MHMKERRTVDGYSGTMVGTRCIRKFGPNWQFEQRCRFSIDIRS